MLRYRQNYTGCSRFTVLEHYTNLKFDRAELFEPMKGGEMVKQYKELEDLVFEHSLYLKPSVIQAIADLKLDDLRTRIQQEPRESKGSDRATFNENHLDRLWSKAKRIMTEMRQELDLGPYPEDVMRIWR